MVWAATLKNIGNLMAQLSAYNISSLKRMVLHKPHTERGMDDS